MAPTAPTALKNKPKPKQKKNSCKNKAITHSGGSDPVSEYEFKVHGAPAFAELEVILKQGQIIHSDGGALAYKREGVDRASLTVGSGLISSIGRAFAGESLLMNKYTGIGNHGPGNSVTFASAYPGDVLYLQMRAGDSYILSRGSFLAASPNIKITGKLNWRGVVSIGQEEGVVLPRIECKSGSGCAWLAAYGSFRKHELLQGESMIVDNGLFLACIGRTNYTITRLGNSLVSTILGGEGFGMKFAGPCTLYTQSHNFNDLVAKIASRLPDKK